VAKARKTLSEYFTEAKIEIFAANDFFDEQFRFIMTHWWKFRTYYADLLPTLALGFPRKYWFKGFTFKKFSNVGQNFSFGEFALINDSPRAATIICNKYTELLSLKKRDFGQIFAAIMAIEEEKNVFFLKFFAKKMAHSEIIDMQYKFESEVYHRGQMIFKEGDPVDYFFIMASGQIQVSSSVKGQPTKPKVGKPKPAPPKAVPLEIITGQTIFGEDDFFLGRPCRTYTAIAQTTPTTLYKMHKSSISGILKYIQQLYPKTLKRAAQKSNFRKKRLLGFGEPNSNFDVPEKLTWLLYLPNLYDENKEKEKVNSKTKTALINRQATFHGPSRLAKGVMMCSPSGETTEDKKRLAKEATEQQALKNEEITRNLAQQKDNLVLLKEAGWMAEFEKYDIVVRNKFPSDLKELPSREKKSAFVSSYGSMLNSKVYGSH
jgi:CRP-like cAMP-binding protein